MITIDILLMNIEISYMKLCIKIRKLLNLNSNNNKNIEILTFLKTPLYQLEVTPNLSQNIIL